MDQITSFLQDQWYIAAIALVVLLLIVKLVKTVVKWVIVIAIIAGVMVYGANYKDKLADVGASIMDSTGKAVAAEIKDKAMGALTAEAKEAKYTKNADGSFTIKSKTVQLDGKPGSSEVKVTVAGQSFNLNVEGTVKAFIEQAQKNQ